MNLIYEGVDISDSIKFHKVDLTDNSGSEPDSLEIWFDDTQKLWSKWKPEKNHKIQICQNGFKSGLMYVDELEQQRGMFIIRALSIPQEAKNQHSQGWEAVRFLKFAEELASRYDFSLQVYGINDFLYERVDQYEQADFSFLTWRCLLEGYSLKITDNKVIIYKEAYMEEQPTAQTIDISSFDGKYVFLQKSTNIYSSCRIISNGITSEYNPAKLVNGAALKYKDIYVSSQAEGDRYAKNLLRVYNKFESTGRFTTSLDTDLAAASNINISGVGLADGKYFCDRVIHKFIEGKTFIKCRKSLEGY